VKVFRLGAAALLIAAAFVGGYEFRKYRRPCPAETPTPSMVASRAPAPADSATQVNTAAPIVGATYLGRNWAPNVINAFRREDVADDFAQIRKDGFNTVVLIVSWGDFQPVFDPCCKYDERAFERLEFLIEHAREASLSVVLRIGYEWSYHPDAGQSTARVQRVLNEAQTREAFFKFLSRIGEETKKYPNIRLNFLSWEDFQLEAIEPSAAQDFREFVDGLPADSPWRKRAADAAMPTKAGDPPLFYAYWDWLLMQKLFLPAENRIPKLSYEARVDREPYPQTGADGKTEMTWIGHESTYRPPDANALAIYWAPFWGAKNEGEKLDAAEALRLFGGLLGGVRKNSGALPIFIDQFNVIDNTREFSHNATIALAAIPEFMDAAYCLMRRNGVFGYAYWTVKDFAASPMFNPSFSYGLDGWSVAAGEGAKGPSLTKQSSGDYNLELHAGDTVTQVLSERRGWTRKDAGGKSFQVCLTGRNSAPAIVEVGAGMEPVSLRFDGGGAQKVCEAIAVSAGADPELRIRDVSGSLELTNVVLFDHVQQGGVYGFDGSEGVLLPELRKLNQRFAASANGADDCR
jgi:hypothetical protein